MALAAADFRTSMLSMSFGFRSAKRLTVWSCDDVVLPLERVIEARPAPIDALDTMMPSTT